MCNEIKKDDKTIIPVLLAGGSGTRLWPLSRKSYPKQFSNLIGEMSLFQSSAQRLTSSDIIEFAPHITLTNSDFRFIVCEQLQEVCIDPGPIIIEPEAKNTSAVIAAASIFAYTKDENAILLVAPSDHLIPDTKDFHNSISVGLSHVHNGKIVTFGIKPTHPETGYGYMELSNNNLDQFRTCDVIKFVEKPNLRQAKKMLEVNDFFWNAGIFLFKAKDMIEAFKVYDHETLNLVSKSIKSASPDLGFLRLATQPWSKLQNISIDYAIMEKVKNLVAVPYSSKWSDLGGWDSVWSESIHDLSGNAISKSAYAIKCSNTLLRSESDNQQVVGIGLKNIMAIAMSDAVLVAHKDCAQDVKRVVEFLKTKDVLQAEVFPKDYRPWGWFESLVQGDYFQVKRIFVKPKAAISLQSHNYRSEHWIVVEGKAKVTINEEVKLINEGQSVYVPSGAVHRMENPEQRPMVLIEVQVGTYFGEDDIIRYEDIYNRN
ncbi:MAG: mannose-1-phosphate guanylyltransferase/mannose-6-phosphate isomerase [Legionellales bacterium]|nr:mannose-1-phosphate guanylyltransferase/mannose-6-phosphate isomerase [Legionellales bacterium]OUX66231.1 MAG: mannose-1-phosphate guanylyltransferase/mannose-6-phosphate isomerase [Gammaproteobacteria bacterium TMED281]